MHPELQAFLEHVEKNKNCAACVCELIETYYQNVVYADIDLDDDCDETLFSAEFLLPPEERASGIGAALIQLLDRGNDIDRPRDGSNALMHAVGSGDAPMTHFLLLRGADPNSWPEMSEEPELGFGNWYLDEIDICYLNESICNDKNIDYLKGLYNTVLVLADEGHLGPYYGHCLVIEENGRVSIEAPRFKF